MIGGLNGNDQYFSGHTATDGNPTLSAGDQKSTPLALHHTDLTAHIQAEFRKTHVEPAAGTQGMNANLAALVRRNKWKGLDGVLRGQLTDSDKGADKGSG